MAQIYFANLNDSFINLNDKFAKLTGKTYIIIIIIIIIIITIIFVIIIYSNKRSKTHHHNHKSHSAKTHCASFEMSQQYLLITIPNSVSLKGTRSFINSSYQNYLLRNIILKITKSFKLNINHWIQNEPGNMDIRRTADMSTEYFQDTTLIFV